MTDEAARAILFDAGVYGMAIGIVLLFVAAGVGLIGAAWRGE